METPTLSGTVSASDARTPLAHPGLYAVIAILSVVIVVGAAWVFWPRTNVPPAPSPSSSAPPINGSTYTNDQFGLRIELPESWAGFGVTTFEWIAEDMTSTASGRTIAKGPLIHFVHPSVAGGNPHQDIPVMIFTLEEWSHVGGDRGDWSVSAAPMAPSELARNTKYVFALPARYNYGFLPGWEEVEQILQSGAVSSFEPRTSASPRASYPPLDYSNPTHGFALTLTEAWNGFTVIEEINDDGTRTIWFEIPTSDPLYVGSQLPGYVGVLAITISTPAQFTVLEQACKGSPCEPRKLGETATRVYSTSGGMQDVPSDWNTAISPQDALSTFRIMP